MNPFSYGTIVKGEYFYDRHEECKRIVSTLAGGNNIVLFAPRRFGKTSLVFRAMEDILDLPEHLASEGKRRECIFDRLYETLSFICHINYSKSTTGIS